MKSWLEKNAIEMYSIHKEGKYVVAERFIRTLKNKIYKYMTSTSKNVYIDKLDDIVNKCNNTYHRIMKMKPVDVKPSTYILTLIKKIIGKVLNLKLVIMLEYQNIKTLSCIPKLSEKILVIKKVKTTVPWTYVISDLN